LVSVLSEFFAQSVDDAKEQGKDAGEAEAQRSAEKFLCFLCKSVLSVDLLFRGLVLGLFGFQVDCADGEGDVNTVGVEGVVDGAHGFIFGLE